MYKRIGLRGLSLVLAVVLLIGLFPVSALAGDPTEEIGSSEGGTQENVLAVIFASGGSGALPTEKNNAAHIPSTSRGFTVEYSFKDANGNLIDVSDRDWVVTCEGAPVKYTAENNRLSVTEDRGGLYTITCTVTGKNGESGSYTGYAVIYRITDLALDNTENALSPNGGIVLGKPAMFHADTLPGTNPSGSSYYYKWSVTRGSTVIDTSTIGNGSMAALGGDVSDSKNQPVLNSVGQYTIRCDVWTSVPADATTPSVASLSKTIDVQYPATVKTSVDGEEVTSGQIIVEKKNSTTSNVNLSMYPGTTGIVMEGPVSYQWWYMYEEAPGEWTNPTIINNAKSQSYMPVEAPNKAGRYKFRCVATNSEGRAVAESDSTFVFYNASMRVKYGTNEISGDSPSLNMIPNGKVEFNLTPSPALDGVAHRLYYQKDGDEEPTEIEITGVNATTWDLAGAGPGTYTFTYKIMTSSGTPKVYASASQKATFVLDVDDKLTMSPEFGVAGDGQQEVTLSVRASIDNTTKITWEQSVDNAAPNPITDATGKEYVAKYDCTGAGKKTGATVRYRCTLRNGGTTKIIESDPVYYYVPEVADSAAAQGMPATLEMKFTKPALAANAPISYQWYSKDAKGTRGDALSDGTTENMTVAGSRTAVLTISQDTPGVYEYECVATYSGSSVEFGCASAKVTVYDVSIESTINGKEVTGARVNVDEVVLTPTVKKVGATTDIGISKAGTSWERSVDGVVFTPYTPAKTGDSGVITVKESVGRTYWYRPVLKLSDKSTGEPTITGPAKRVDFYDVTLWSEPDPTRFYSLGAEITLHAQMEPEQAAEGVTYTYAWFEVKKDGGTEPIDDSAGEPTCQVTPEEAGVHKYRCKVSDQVTKAEIITKDLDVEIYDIAIKEPVKVKVDPKQPWINTGDEVKFVVTGGPNNGTYIWRWHDETATDDDFVPTEGQVASSETFVHTQSSGGAYTYRCDVYDADKNKIAELTTNVIFYGVTLTPVPSDYTNAAGEVFVPFGTAPPAYINAEVKPHPGSTASGAYQYDWYIADPSSQDADHPGWKKIGENSTVASLRIDADGLRIGNRRYRCEAKQVNSKGDLEVVGSGETDFMVHYIVDVIADPDSDLAAGDQVELSAITDPEITDPDAYFEWQVKIGEYGDYKPVAGVGRDSKVTVTLPSIEQTYRCLIRIPGETKYVGMGQSSSLGARYPLTIEADPATGMVGYPDDVTMTAKCSPAPQAPKYRWEMKSGEDWIQVPGSANGPELRVQQETSTPTEYRCLMGSKKAPVDAEDENCLGIAEFTVTGYALEMTEIEDPNVSAGKSVTLEAKITPKTPIGDITYQWYVSTTGKYEPIPDTNSNKVQVVPPEGGEYDYRCVATLPGGRTVSNEISLSSTQRNFKVTITPGQSDTTRIPLGKPFTLAATVNSNPKDVVEWQWQQLEKGGWVDVQRTDATEPTITLLPDETGTWHYRAVAVVAVDADGGAKSTVRSADITTTFVEGTGDSDSSLKPWGGGSSSSSNNSNADFPLTSGARFTITNTKPYRVKGISAASKGVGMTVQDVLKSFVVREADGQRVQMVDKNGRVKSPTDPVCTGDVVTLIGPNNAELNRATVVVNGDVLGNGKMQLSQIVKMAQHMKSSTLTDVYLEAGDWTGTGDIGLSDLVVQAKELKNATTK